MAAPNRKARLVEQVLKMPASFWNLSVREHVTLRARTKRLLQAPEEVQNPIEFPPTNLAVLDLEDAGPRGEFFDKVVERLYEHIFEQKVFTAAAPVVVFWEPFGKPSKPRWSVAVPVTEGAKVSPPLRLHRLPASRVHLERLAVKDAQKVVAPVVDKARSVYEMSLVGIAATRKKVSLAVAPEIVFIRLPDIQVGPTGPESIFEILFVEKISEAQKASESAAPLAPQAEQAPRTPPAPPPEDPLGTSSP